MGLDLDTGRLGVFIGGLGLFFFLESFVPARRSNDGRVRRLIFHAAIAVLNTAIVRVVVYAPFLFWAAYVAEQGWGLGRWLGFQGWPEVIVSVIILDLFDYFWHRANHQIPFL
jgi:sterol desaturase/sphingolipid hydroxylase (fatty acid hydroxylase superfamily)